MTQLTADIFVFFLLLYALLAHILPVGCPRGQCFEGCVGSAVVGWIAGMRDSIRPCVVIVTFFAYCEMVVGVCHALGDISTPPD